METGTCPVCNQQFNLEQLVTHANECIEEQERQEKSRKEQEEQLKKFEQIKAERAEAERKRQEQEQLFIQLENEFSRVKTVQPWKEFFRMFVWPDNKQVWKKRVILNSYKYIFNYIIIFLVPSILTIFCHCSSILGILLLGLISFGHVLTRDLNISYKNQPLPRRFSNCLRAGLFLIALVLIGFRPHVFLSLAAILIHASLRTDLKQKAPIPTLY